MQRRRRRAVARVVRVVDVVRRSFAVFNFLFLRKLCYRFIFDRV